MSSRATIDIENPEPWLSGMASLEAVAIAYHLVGALWAVICMWEGVPYLAAALAGVFLSVAAVLVRLDRTGRARDLARSGPPTHSRRPGPFESTLQHPDPQ